MLADNANTYAYDKEGNLVSRVAKVGGATTTYSWSAEHQLLGITYPNATTAKFAYDPLGRRVAITEGTTTTRYAYDRQAIAAEYDGSNTLLATYIRPGADPTRALEMVRGGQRYFYLADAQQSTTALTALDGSVAATYAYDAFGTPTQTTGTVANPFTYTGQLHDAAAGLLLFPLRAYDPKLGRFLSEDPKPPVNPYPYVFNSPTNMTDPTGAAGSLEEAVLDHIAANEVRAAASFSATALVQTLAPYLAIIAAISNLYAANSGCKFGFSAAGLAVATAALVFSWLGVAALLLSFASSILTSGKNFAC
jgi:RHS repeat-associated protein